MTQTRNTIDLLTNILKENGASKVKAETFRLAKFNHDDAVAPLWRLLFELVYHCEFGKIDNVSVRACAQFTTEELVVYVKREMQIRGFYSKEFALLPNDMSSGSREILLALGWIMCKENIINRFIRSCTSPLDQNTTQLFTGDESVGCNKTDQSEDKNKQDMYARVQQLLMLNNKLRLSLKTLYTLQRDNSLLKHKIHEATYGVVGASGDRSHLSEMEVYMLRHPQLLKNNLELLEQDNERLQNLLSWRDHEDHFWKWMGSVLDAKLQCKALIAEGETANTKRSDGISTKTQGAAAADELSVVSGRPSSAVNGLPMTSGLGSFAAVYSRPGGSNRDMSLRNASAGKSKVTQGRGVRDDEVSARAVSEPDNGMYSRLEHSHLTLQEAIIKYESIVEHLENVWEQKSSEITDSELDSVLSSIEQELAFQSTNIMLHNCHTYLQNDTPDGSTSLTNDCLSTSDPPPSDPRLYYDRKLQGKQLNTRLRGDESSVTSSVNTTGSRDQHISSIEHEIHSLHHLVDKLQNEVEEKQNRFKYEMQTLSSKFQEAICIPPITDHQ